MRPEPSVGEAVTITGLRFVYALGAALDREQDSAIGEHAIAVERSAENVKKAQRGSFHGLSDGRLRPDGRSPREAATNKEGRLGKD
jgi:hypothetical protein